MSGESSTSSTSSGAGGEATVSRKERITGNMDNAGLESLAIIRRARRPERQRRSRRRRISNSVMKKMTMMKEESPMSVCSVVVNGSGEEEGKTEEEEEDEKAEVESKINALQKIVPGGESLGLDSLFEETAGYILELQFQVKALKFLTNFVEGSEKEKRKLGG